jgi:hypothetical protein
MTISAEKHNIGIRLFSEDSFKTPHSCEAARSPFARSTAHRRRGRGIAHLILTISAIGAFDRKTGIEDQQRPMSGMGQPDTNDPVR